jgi:hypothetical protein
MKTRKFHNRLIRADGIEFRNIFTGTYIIDGIDVAWAGVVNSKYSFSRSKVNRKRCIANNWKYEYRWASDRWRGSEAS